MRLPQPAIQRKPRSHFELIFGIQSCQATHWVHVSRSQIRRTGLRTSSRRWRRTVEDQAEELRILLCKGIEPRSQVIALLHPSDCRLAALILRGTVFCRRTRYIQRAAFVIRTVEVEER